MDGLTSWIHLLITRNKSDSNSINSSSNEKVLLNIKTLCTCLTLLNLPWITGSLLFIIHETMMQQFFLSFSKEKFQTQIDSNLRLLWVKHFIEILFWALTCLKNGRERKQFKSGQRSLTSLPKYFLVGFSLITVIQATCSPALC